jgi:hypothetical protein
VFPLHVTSLGYQWRQISGVPPERHQPPFSNATNELFPASTN